MQLLVELDDKTPFEGEVPRSRAEPRRTHRSSEKTKELHDPVRLIRGQTPQLGDGRHCRSRFETQLDEKPLQRGRPATRPDHTESLALAEYDTLLGAMDASSAANAMPRTV